jgi:7,8-dihydroneopterin aldolase/epimerase/oxygenase
LFTIYLNNCRFFSRHGIHKEESITGADFEVNLEASFEEEGPVVHLDDTINYVLLYDIVKKHLAEPRALLETIAQQIANDIHQEDDRIKTITVSIKKINPPIVNFSGSVSISYTKKYS